MYLHVGSQLSAQCWRRTIVYEFVVVRMAKPACLDRGVGQWRAAGVEVSGEPPWGSSGERVLRARKSFPAMLAKETQRH